MIDWIERARETGSLFWDAKGRPKAIAAPPSAVVDTHAHLTMMGPGDGKRLTAESAEAAAHALARAWCAGVCWVISVADASEDAVDAAAYLAWLDEVEARAGAVREAALDAGIEPALPEEPMRVGLAAGVHPYGAATLAEGGASAQATLASLATLVRDRRCVAVGECGLDYHCDVPPELQRRAFAAQIEFAKGEGLPLELHVRDADGDTAFEAHRDALEIVDAMGVDGPMVDLHCYTLGPAQLRPWIERGCHAAFGGVVTFKRSDEVRRAARECPSHQILTETDCPYLAPEPIRGTANEPASTLINAWRVAEVRALDGHGTEATFRQLWRNASQLFDARLT